MCACVNVCVCACVCVCVSKQACVMSYLGLAVYIFLLLTVILGGIGQ